MEFVGTSRPKSVHLSVQGVQWVLRTPPNHAHKLSVDMELTYFNGTAYKKVVQPFQIQLALDSNNSFEEAREIAQGTYSKLYLGGYDKEDYYRIYVPQNHLIQVYAHETGPANQAHPAFYVNLYTPEEKWKTGSSSTNYSQNTSCIADSSGEWFIQVLTDGYSFGYYELQMTVRSQESG